MRKDTRGYCTKITQGDFVCSKLSISKIVVNKKYLTKHILKYPFIIYFETKIYTLKD